MVINKKFNMSVILSYIGVALFLLGVIISFAIFGPHDKFIALFNELLETNIEPGMTLGQYIQINNIEPSSVLAALYIYFTLNNIIAAVIGALALIFTALVSKDGKKGLSDFKAHKGLQITYIVFLGIAMFTEFTNISQLFLLPLMIVPIILLVAFIFAIMGISDNKKKILAVNYYNNKKNQEVAMNATIEPVYQNNEVKEEVKEETAKEEVVDNQKEEVKETPIEVNVNFDEMYTKLAELEKLYQHGKVTDQEYLDKKHDIFEQYKW